MKNIAQKDGKRQPKIKTEMSGKGLHGTCRAVTGTDLHG